jgi:transcriptional regulator GlxA family with amidase domain
MKINIIVFDGVDEFDFLGPYEMLKEAARLGKEVEVSLVSLRPQEEIISNHGIRFKSQGVMEEDVELVIVPGGGWITRAEQGLRKEIEFGALQQQIVNFHAKGAILVGVCTGVMAIAAAGLLNGRMATTHHQAMPELSKAGAKVVRSRVVDIGDMITCGGFTSSLDLGMWIVERFWGIQTADSIAEYLEYHRNKDVQVFV